MIMSLKRITHWILINIKKPPDFSILLPSLTRYIKSLRYRSETAVNITIYLRTILFDLYKSSGQFSAEYHHQDLFVSQLIYHNQGHVSTPHLGGC